MYENFTDMRSDLTSYPTFFKKLHFINFSCLNCSILCDSLYCSPPDSYFLESVKYCIVSRLTRKINFMALLKKSSLGWYSEKNIQKHIQFYCPQSHLSLWTVKHLINSFSSHSKEHFSINEYKVHSP